MDIGPVTAASSPTRSRRFTPPGSLTGPGRSRATRLLPDRARADSEYSGPLGSGRLGIRPRYPCPARAYSDYRRIVGSGRLGSQRPVTSHDVGYSGPAGCGNLPVRVRVSATAGPMPMVEQSEAADLKQVNGGPGTTTWHSGVHLKLHVTGRRRSYSTA